MYKLQVSSHTKMDAEKQFSAQEWTKILNFSLEQNQSFLSRVNFRYSNIPTLAEVVLFFFDTQGHLCMFMRLCWGPEPQDLFIIVPTQVEICLVTEEKNVQERRLFFSVRSLNTLTKLQALGLVGPALSLKNLYFVWKQFLVAMNDLHQRTPGNPHFLWQPSGGLSWWLLQTSPNVLNVCWCSGSQTRNTVGLVVCLPRCHCLWTYVSGFWWC